MKKHENETITIETTQGQQEWARKNLAVKNYRSGKPIKQITSAEEVYKILNEELDQEPRWMYYNLDPSTEKTHGLLYMFPIGIGRYQSVVNEIIEPEGWRIPTGDEVEILFTEYGNLSGLASIFDDKNLVSREIDLTLENSREIKELFSANPGGVLPYAKEVGDEYSFHFHFTNEFSSWDHPGNRTTMGQIILTSNDMMLFEDIGVFLPVLEKTWESILRIDECQMDSFLNLSFVKCLKDN